MCRTVSMPRRGKAKVKRQRSKGRHALRAIYGTVLARLPVVYMRADARLHFMGRFMTRPTAQRSLPPGSSISPPRHDTFRRHLPTTQSDDAFCLHMPTTHSDHTSQLHIRTARRRRRQCAAFTSTSSAHTRRHVTVHSDQRHQRTPNPPLQLSRTCRRQTELSNVQAPAGDTRKPIRPFSFCLLTFDLRSEAKRAT